MALTTKQAERLDQTFHYLSPSDRQKIIDAADILADVKEKLWSLDYGCSAIKLEKALGELLDEPVVVEHK